MNTHRDQPPSTWEGINATPAGDDIYYRVQPGMVMVWHWCTAVAPGPGEVVDNGRWAGSGCGKHTLVNLIPLHLEPSILFECCGLHGYIRNGRWEAA